MKLSQLSRTITLNVDLDREYGEKEIEELTQKILIRFETARCHYLTTNRQLTDVMKLIEIQLGPLRKTVKPILWVDKTWKTVEGTSFGSHKTPPQNRKSKRRF